MKQDPKYTEEIIEVPGMKYGGKNIRVQKFMLPDGKEGRWESRATIPKTPGILTVGLTPEGKIILVSMYRLPIKSWMLELPGGSAEVGEDLKVAAEREFLEETGYEGKYFEKIGEGYVWTGGTDIEYTLFFAKNCKKVKDQNIDPVEKYLGVEVVEVDPQYVIKEIADGNKKYHPELTHALLILMSKGEINI